MPKTSFIYYIRQVPNSVVTRNSVPHRHFRKREEAILYVTDPDYREFVELRRGSRLRFEPVIHGSPPNSLPTCQDATLHPQRRADVTTSVRDLKSLDNNSIGDHCPMTS